MCLLFYAFYVLLKVVGCSFTAFNHTFYFILKVLFKVIVSYDICTLQNIYCIVFLRYHFDVIETGASFLNGELSQGLNL